MNDRDVWFEMDSPAKLNLTLRVAGRRPDGYHELETVMIPISWADRLRLRIEPNQSVNVEANSAKSDTKNDEVSQVSLEIQHRFQFRENNPQATRDDVARIPTGDDNLIVRIAKGWLKAVGCTDRVHFHLWKSLPAGGGLGGASSNAATALRLLNHALGTGWTWEQLAEFSAQYGSDIPFFMQSSAAVCRGRGERVAPFPFANTGWLVVVRPPFALSTPLVFRALAEQRRTLGAVQQGSGRATDLKDQSQKSWANPKLMEKWKSGLNRIQRGALLNDLQPAALSLREDMQGVEESLQRSLPLGEQMSGSGSCWFGVFRHRKQALWAARRCYFLFATVEIARPRSS